VEDGQTLDGAPSRAVLAGHHAVASCAIARVLDTQPARAPLFGVRMQEPAIDTESLSFYDEFRRSDPETGEQQPISFAEKEKLYMECLDAYYNDGGKQLLPDDEYETLKTDLNFEGSIIATLSKDEIRFVLANKRFAMKKPIMSDSEYDSLRTKLKEIASPVILHEAPSCTIDGICKLDLKVDAAKQRLLYFPGTVGASLVFSELSYWVLGTDPIIGLVLAAVPSYFFGIWFTENIFGQKPLVTVAACPDCNSLNNVFFGDLFNVATDGIIPGGPPTDIVELPCSNCKAPLLADRSKMIIQTTVPKGQKA